MSTTPCSKNPNNKCSVLQLTKSSSATVSSKLPLSQVLLSKQTSQEAADRIRAQRINKIRIDAPNVLPSAATLLPCSAMPTKSTGASVANVSCTSFATPTTEAATILSGDPQSGALPRQVTGTNFSPAPTARRESHTYGRSLWSCLGDVQPLYEALKVGLDSDDSSLDSNGSDGNDFFFGDGHDHSFNTDCSSDDNDNTMTLDYFHKPSSGIQLAVPTLVQASPSLLHDQLDQDCCSGTSSFAPPPFTSPEPCISPFVQLSASVEPTTLIISDLLASQRDVAPSLRPVFSSSETLTTSELTNNSSRESLLTEASSNTALPLVISSRVSKRSNKRQKKRRVSLHSSVAIIPIPSRSEYSTPIQRCLWSSPHELCSNAARNSVEFASEGWNWRNVTEDENMLVHEPSGELIHPVHLQNALACMAAKEKEREDSIENLMRGIVPNRDFIEKRHAECLLGSTESINSNSCVHLPTAASTECKSATMSALA